eukprot:scaffold190670_cov49-Attheya_sp.AAC.2
MTRVPVRFTCTVSTELNYAMIGRRNATGRLLLVYLLVICYYWSSLLVVYSWSTRGLYRRYPSVWT